MKTRFEKVYAYEIITPKLHPKGLDLERYDHEQVDFFINEILKKNEADRAVHYKNKMINLISYRQTEDTDLMEGRFSSARFGQEQDIIDVYRQTTTGVKGRNEGVKNEVHFVLQKSTGLLLVQYDNQKVVSREMMKKFFYHHRDLVKGYKKEFNKINSPYIIPRSFMQIKTLPSKQFFEELREFASIKEAFVIADLARGTNNDALEYLRNEAEGVEDYQQIRISFLNKIKRSGIKHIEAFFRRLYESEAYDGYGVQGKTYAGKTKQITMEKVPHNYDVEVSVNDQGIIDSSELIKGMVDIVKRERLLWGKNHGIEELKPVTVGENSNDDIEEVQID
jgi:hypothetical protein